MDDLRDVREDEYVTTHKGDSDVKIASDGVDGNKLRDKLRHLYQPFKPTGLDKGGMYIKCGANL